LRALEGITLRLSSAFPDAPPMDREDVARLVMELQQGHEECLGVSSNAPRPMMKIPSSHWRDFASGGALFLILKTALAHKLTHKLRRLDWQSEKKRAEFIDLTFRCQAELHKRGMRRVVRVALADGEFVTVEAVSRVALAVKATGAVLAVSPNDEGVTHVLHASAPAIHSPPNSETRGGDHFATSRNEIDGDPEHEKADPEHSCVVLGVLGKEALVRYLRYPESYEHWVPLAAATKDARPGFKKHNFHAPPPGRDDDTTRDHLCLGAWWGSNGNGSGNGNARQQGQGVTHVLAKWLTDSAMFNEWCEEGEYAWEDPATRAARAAQEALEARELETQRARAQVQNPAGPLTFVVGDKRPGSEMEMAKVLAKKENTRGAGGEVLAPARFAERVAPNVVRRQIVTPHRLVSAACAGDFGEGPASVLATVTGPGAVPGMNVYPGPADARPAVPVLENISRGQRGFSLAAAAKVRRALQDAASPLFDQDDDVDMTTPGEGEADTETTTTQTETHKETHVLPGYAAWFVKDCVHAIERAGVPEFFETDAENGEACYTAMRDATMGAYRALRANRGADVSKELTFTQSLISAMRTAAPAANASAQTQQRVFDFCARWGLVNWTGETSDGSLIVDWEAPSGALPGTTANAADALYRFTKAPTNGALAVASALAAKRTREDVVRVREIMGAPRGVGRPRKDGAPPGMAGALHEAVSAGLGSLPGTRQESFRLDTDFGKPRHCTQCQVSLVGAGRAYYRVDEAGGNTHPREVCVTCVSCFASGSLPDGVSSASFTRVVSTDCGDSRDEAATGDAKAQQLEKDDDSETEDDESWTDQETLALLEAAERHGEDWRAVAARVGTKSAEQCVIRFVRLPVEDGFLAQLGVDGDELLDGDGGTHARVPFHGAPNPVMANVAFLAT
jgi:SWI/SNF related-matrix-associated actin-dependent regulator of chromatin subfamily C|tara:strand:+ start:14926 stop:17655 length:2730 start_codon:yes stop_codon:yes gene_type:complete